MAIAENKSERIEVRTTPNMKALLQRAAASSHKNVTEFLLEAGINAAEDALVDRIEYEALDGEKPLCVSGGLEPAHLPLALTSRLMRDLRSVVFVLPSAVDHGRHHGAVRRRVAAQLVRDQSSGLAALSFQQLAEKPFCRSPIAPRSYEGVEDVAVLVDGPPQILQSPLDLDEQFIQIPGVALAALAVPQSPRIGEPEPQTPLPNRLVGHGNTAFGEEILDIPKTQAETVVEPDGVTDDFRGKSVSAVAGWLVIGYSGTRSST